ncbi:MAG: acyl-ACP--UDP-N-acetylglucosamine O-acyltransferase, partial [Candidatus Eiseniibacteriota bacterium]
MSVLVHASSFVDPKAKLGVDVEIGPGTVIGPNVVVGDRCVIQ